jgi:simple sugar transport system permease protein
MSTRLSNVDGRVGKLFGSVFERRESSVIVGLLVIFLIGAVTNPARFLTLDNQFRVLRSAAIVTLIGYGMAVLMTTAEFDLSVGSLFALASGLAAIMIGELGYSPIFAIVVVIAFSVVYGVTQGLLVTKLGLPSLIITIGTLTLVRGVHRLVLGGQSETISPEQKGVILSALGGTIELPFVISYRVPFVHEEIQRWSSFSVQIVWVFLLLGLFHYLLFYTRFGHHIRATGDNINSVETTGVDPEILKLACFGIAAAMAAFAGLTQLGRIESVSPNTGNGLALIVIAAVVLGGTKLTGGEGSIVGVLMGAVILSLAQNILALEGFGVGGWQAIITGLFIIAAIGLDTVFKGFTVGLLRRWYLAPLRGIVTSPTEFFRTRAIQKTTDDMLAFLIVTVGVTGILVGIGMWAMRALAAVVGLGELEFRLFVAGDWTVAVIQVYLLVLFLALVSFVVLEVLSQSVGGSGDYESTLAVVCFGLAPVVLSFVPQVTFGFGIVTLVNPAVTALVVVIPILAIIGGLMTVGVAVLHDLPRRQAVVPVGGTLFVWALIAAWVAVSVA